MSKNLATDLQHVDFYETMVDSLPEGILWTDRNNVILHSNDTACRWLGFPKQQLINQEIEKVIPSNEVKEWLALLIKNPGSNYTPLTYIKDQTKINVYAMVSISIGLNQYNCFVLKEEGTPGMDPNEMLRIISEGTSSVIGGDFFRSLAYHIIISTGIRYAIVTECANISKTRVRTLVYIERDHFLDNFEYNLNGTPCEIVMQGENYYCTSDLDALFPKEEGVKSYFGVPIYLSNGEVIGHIAIFDTKPMTISEQKLNVLKIFASRAGAEIERKRKDEQLHDNMVRYQALFEESPIGLGEEDLSQMKKYVDQIKLNYKKPLSEIFEIYPHEVDECYKKLKRLNANKAQVSLFELNTKEQYFQYLAKFFQPKEFKDVILTFDMGETIFEREIAVKTSTGNKRYLKAKRAILPGSENDWMKTILTCVDITELKQVQEDLKTALSEVKQLKEQLEAENIYLQQEIKHEHNFDEIVSQSTVFKKVLEKIQQVSGTDATVLILGESGTGKELIARAIHNNSKRNKRPLVKINCAALPANLIESELFGHEKGAFTGAIAHKTGRFELAHGGTIFLDEIGEMPLEIQAKLLRVLQEGEFERVGSSKTLKVDVRVIAATNRELDKSVNNKEFRSDLFYRLNVFPINSPPLRERKEDIPLLVSHFCKKYGIKTGKKIISVSKDALHTLMAYDWPGNVRELENVIERGIIITNTSTLDEGDWLPSVQTGYSPQTGSPIAKSLSMEDLERQHILETLRISKWKIRGEDGAAKILALNPTTLEARMKKLGIQKPR